MIHEFFNIEIYKYLLIFLRLGSAIMLMPGFTSTYVNMRLRLSIALAVSLVLLPFLETNLPAPPADFLESIKICLIEITCGVFFGVIMQIFYSALNLAGNFAGTAIGFSSAQLFDPSTQTQSIVLETFLSIIALTLIFITDLHHLMISAVVDSYTLFPAGQPLPLNDFADFAGSSLSQSFITGFKLSSPFIAFTIIFYTGMGLVSRLMPQLNIFFLSLPLQIYLGLGLLFITLPAVIFWFVNYFEAGLYKFTG